MTTHIDLPTALALPRLFGQLFPMTLPWPSGEESGYGRDLGVKGYTLGEPTLFLMSGATNERGWYCWALCDDGCFYGQTTHVTNSLLDENPWLSGWLDWMVGHG